MSRKYVKIDEHGKEILELKREGKTNREIAQKFGVDRECIRNRVTRFNRQQRKLTAGITSHAQKADLGKMLSQEILLQSKHMRSTD